MTKSKELLVAVIDINDKFIGFAYGKNKLEVAEMIKRNRGTQLGKYIKG